MSEPIAAIGNTEPVDHGLDHRLEDERSIADVADRLAERYPTLAREWIADIVAGCLTETRGARVQAFRLVLAEREARRRLEELRQSMPDVQPDPVPLAVLTSGRRGAFSSIEATPAPSAPVP